MELVVMDAPPPPPLPWYVHTRPVCGDADLQSVGFGRDVGAVPCLQLPPSAHGGRIALHSRMRRSGCVAEGVESVLSAPERVLPDAREREAIDRASKLVFAVVEVCVTVRGSVGSSRLVRSTGFARYDDALVAAARDWKLEPSPEGCGLLGFEYAP
jgi:TonB family protein